MWECAQKVKFDISTPDVDGHNEPTMDDSNGNYFLFTHLYNLLSDPHFKKKLTQYYNNYVSTRLRLFINTHLRILFKKVFFAYFCFT